ncbi:MAG: DUF3810 domain-containing protein [Flavobacteriales bacterium]|nr:DUF3810 domain-containing protein [Flavobacteriales bacterium]
MKPELESNPKDYPENTKIKPLFKRKLFSKISIGTVFSLLFINQVLFLIQPFSSDFIFSSYTQGYFRLTTLIERIVFSIFTFSIGDLLYIFLFLVIILHFFKIIIKLFRRDFSIVKFIIVDFLAILALVWLLLGTQWNWNYMQPTIAEKLHLNTEKYDIEELAAFTKDLIIKTSITQENSNFSVFYNNSSSILDISPLGYKEMAKKDDFFVYNYPSIKYSIFSDLLKYVGVSGYYNPFTAEAQITLGIPIKQMPFVINHEIAHQLGIASEAEANFIGYIASINNPLSTIQYSGHLNLLMYCLSDLRKNKYENYKEITSTIPKAVKNDINEIVNFWESYRNDYRRYSDKGYDMFLKSNQQKDGLNSYNKVVSLAIFYYRTN